MGIKKLILAISGLGILAILFTTVNFYIEKNKHNHPIANMQMNRGEQKTAFNPNQQAKQAPNLGENAMLPENIPPAMLEAMKKQGVSIEDLQRANGQGMPQTGMGSNKQFPEEMMKALAEKNKQQAKLPENDPFQKALEHIRSHGNAEETAQIEQNLQKFQANAGDTDTAVTLAENFLKHNEKQAAELVLQKGIVANPNNAVLPYLLGQSYAADSKFDKAAEQWERALSLQDSAEVHYSLGMLYRYKLSNEEKAKQHFKKSAELPAHSPELAEMLKTELEK